MSDVVIPMLLVMWGALWLWIFGHAAVDSLLERYFQGKREQILLDHEYHKQLIQFEHDLDMMEEEE